MANDSSTPGATASSDVQDVGNGKIIVSKPRFEYRPLESPQGGKPSMFANPRTMALLESAFKIGATYEEAALHSGLPSGESIRYHIKNKTQLAIWEGDKDTGERVEFPDLVELWKGNLTLAAKNAIYASVAAKNTQDSWRVLERRQGSEWGLKPGQGSVDGGGSGIVAPDLGKQSRDNMAEFQTPPAPKTPESPIHVEQNGMNRQNDLPGTTDKTAPTPLVGPSNAGTPAGQGSV